MTPDALVAELERFAEVSKRLRDTPNWSKEAWGAHWKYNVSRYDRTPFEAANLLDQAAEALRSQQEEIARLHQQIDGLTEAACDKILAMTDEQIKALCAFEGHHPDDEAALGHNALEIALLKNKLAIARREALTEAAALCERMTLYTGYDCAEAIERLRDDPPGQVQGDKGAA